MTNTRCWLLGAMLLGACSDAATPGGTGAGEPAPVLVRTDPAGAADCPEGGSVVRAGTDDNHDGVLQDAEAATRTLVCNPAPEAQQPPVVVRLVAEPPGEHCRAGGTAVQSGPDQNGNGQLDDGEVAHVDYVCGQVLLTRLAAEPPGARCVAGGVVFFAGRDRDGDGVLADAEVETTELECGDVLSRDVSISTAADVAALASIRIITGNLSAFGANAETLSLPRLEHVGGSLWVDLNVDLTRLSLPELQDIDGAFLLRANHLATIECPRLHRVGSLEIAGAALTDLSGLSALTEVDHDLRLRSLPSLVSADLPMSSVGGDVDISSNPKLARVVGRLSGSVGSLDIDTNRLLETVDLSVTPRSGTPARVGRIALFGDGALTRFALSAETVGSLAMNLDDTAVAELSLDVAKFESDVFVFATAPLSLTLASPGPGPIEFGGWFVISGPLETMQSAAPVIVDGLCVFDKTRLRAIDARIGLVEARGGIRLSENAQLTEVSPFAVGRGLQLIHNAVLETMPLLPLLGSGELDGVVITDNPVLASVPSLAEIARVGLSGIDIERNPKLDALFAPALIEVDGGLAIVGNGSLTSLSLPNLMHVRELEVSANASLQTLELPALVDSREQLVLRANPRLHHIAFDALVRAATFLVTDNPVLPSCEVRSVFAHTEGGVNFQARNDDAATCAP